MNPQREVSEKQLLNMPLRELNLHFGLSIAKSQPGRLFEQQVKRLRRRKLLLSPSVWWSTEWFCPDGVSGIGVPFYLAHPRLLEMQKKYVGEVEGETEVQCAKLIRHELGHVVDNAYRLRRHPLRKIFGDSKKLYPKSYSPRPYSRSYVKHLSNHYAQSHPDEDFAETFAVWMQPKEQWKRQYRKRPKALSKLKTIDAMLLEVQNCSPILINTKRVEPIDRLKISLSQYYREARKQVEFKERVRIQRDLSQLYKVDTEGTSVDRLLLNHRKHLVRDVANVTGVYQYRVDWILRQMVDKAKQSQVKSKKNSIVPEMRDLLTQYALDYLPQGRDRVIM